MSTPQELFEEIKAQYDETDEQFSEFWASPVGQQHRKIVGYFLHDTRVLAGKVGRALLKGNLPESGKSSMMWFTYNNLRTNMGIMKLILKLWKGRL